MEFTKYNPFVILIYFGCNILITMLTKNPVIIGISIFSSSVYTLLLMKPKKIKKVILIIVIVILIASITNPLFNSNGEIILFKIGKKEFSLEAIIYGMVASIMLIAIVIWLFSYNHLMTTEKFLHLFSKYLPNLALIIANILKLIPEFTRKINSLNESEKILSFSYENGIIGRLKSKFKLFGNLFSWAIENSIITASSMKARGYGLKGKTNYSIYKFIFKDLIMSLIFIAVTIFIIIYGSNILFNYSFYPNLTPLDFSLKPSITYITYTLFANYASLNLVKEKIKWHYLNSKIHPSPMH